MHTGKSLSVAAVMIFLVGIAVTAGVYGSYRQTTNRLGRELAAVAATLAASLDGDRQRVMAESGEFSGPVYEESRRRLKAALKALRSEDIRYIYTMVKTGHPSFLKIILNTDDSDSAAKPGDLYDIARLRHMEDAFHAPLADSRAYKDQWDEWLFSAYAPIFDSAGEAVAIVGVDVWGGDLRRKRLQALFDGALLLSLGIALSLLVLYPFRQIASIADRSVHDTASLWGRIREGLLSVSGAGDKQNGYRIGGVIGKGGMATVYLAEQVALHRPVALKSIGSVGMTDRALVRFKREAQTVAKLKHPNIVTVYDAGTRADSCFIAFEFVAAPSLGAVLQRLRVQGGPFGAQDMSRAVREAGEEIFAEALSQWPAYRIDANEQFWQRPYARVCLDIAADVAKALAYAHGMGIVHRDVKPANILLGVDGVARLIDFGLTKAFEQDSLTQTSEFLGTLHYASPEQVVDGSAGSKPGSDIFSLGVTLYEMLTLQRPFQGVSVHETVDRLKTRQPTPASLVNPDVNADTDSLLASLLEKDPAKRPTAADICRLLEK